MSDEVLTNETGKNVLGILGGMGPLASSEFLKTIYERSLRRDERCSPRIVLYSDTGFPDRTEAIRAGAHNLLLERLTCALEELLAVGAQRIVICCLTIHYLLPALPAELAGRVWSLLDVIFSEVAESRARHLLLCTSGARSMEIFQQHRMWEQTKHSFVLPDESDQRLVHELIYKIKRNENLLGLTPVLQMLLSKYEVRSFVAGCTELHLLAKQSLFSGLDQRAYGCIDPLGIIAEQLTAENIEELAEELI